ncbi:MAG: hypothetical protein JW795_23190, partial [Chitinivibrionales bacterium]|nr:hypothetical protein [Chitinivibrionales bacterium]
ASGMLMTDATDLELPGPIPFKLERTYYSRSAHQGALGYGWTHSYDQQVWFEKSRIVLHSGDGRDIYFNVVPVHGSTDNHTERMSLKRHSSAIVITTHDNLTWHFAECGRKNGTYSLQKITDRNENAITLAYDNNGYLITVIDSAGRTIGFTNDQFGRLCSVTLTDPDDSYRRIRVLRYCYSPQGDLSAVYDAMEQPFQYKYKYHLLVQETNRNGLSFYFAYDGIDKDAWCVHTWGDNGIHDHLLIYDKTHGITVVENSLGHKTTYMTDKTGAVIKIIDPNGGQVCFTYDEYGRKTAETDQMGLETSYRYDDRGNRIESVNPDKSKIQISYNEDNLPVLMTDRLGGTWRWEYDKRLRLTKRTDPENREHRFIYENRFLSGVIDAAGQLTSVSHDKQGNRLSLRLPDGATATWSYDLWGRCNESVDAMNNRRGFVFDRLGRIVQVNQPDDNVVTLRYDPEGNEIHCHDKHYSADFLYGGMNRLQARIQNKTRIEFLYDTEERFIGIKNEHGISSTFQLDPVGSVIEETNFNGSQRFYRRDAKGRIERIYRPGGLVTSYAYDSGDRISSIQHSDGTFEQFSYRIDGELIEAKNNASTVKLEKAASGKVIKEWQNDHWVQSEYDILGRRIQVRSSLGMNQRINRTSTGDVDSIQIKGLTSSRVFDWEAQFVRDLMGLELQIEMSNGITSRWHRDRLGRPVNHTVTSSGGYFRSRSYAWDFNDHLRRIDDSMHGLVYFTHDPTGTLSSVRHADGKEFLRFADSVGNVFNTEAMSDRVYGKAGELLQSTTPNGITTYRYDPEGNLIEKTEHTGNQWHYHWDGTGRLVKVDRPDGQCVEFTYDCMSRRLSKTYNNKTTHWVWDGKTILHEFTVDTKPCVNSDSGNRNPADGDRDTANKRRDSLLAGRQAQAPPDIITWIFQPETFKPIAKFEKGEYYSLLTDHLGTPFAGLDNQGKKVWDSQLDANGAVVNGNGKRTFCPFRFPGQYEDEETGLYYNRFRYYDPQNGSYITQDPIGILGGLNLYAYVHDPSAWQDPFGLSPLPDFDALKKMVQTMDFSTAKDGAVFWAGDRMKDAQEWALKNGKTTLEQTQGGKILDSMDLFNVLTKRQAKEIWDIASKRFAEGASGEASVFRTAQGKLNSFGQVRTWWRIEKEALMKNPAVHAIVNRRKDGTPVAGGCVRK